MSRIRELVRENRTNPNAIAYFVLAVAALIFPMTAQFLTGGSGDYLVSLAADGGIFVLMAIGLNVVVGFAGLLDLGYAAFFAIGAYTYGAVASNLGLSWPAPANHAIHIPFWIALFIGLFIAAGMGALLGAPTLRLRGDYLAIVTLGFGEIVPRVFNNGGQITGGVNGVTALDPPRLPGWINGPWAGLDFGWASDVVLNSANATAWYVLMVILITACVILVNNLYRSRIGRAWMAIREDEVAAAAMGVNTVNYKLLAFAIGASVSGFAGAYYGAKLAFVNSDSFSFVVSVTILVMVVLGGMGNIPGVMIGSLVVYFVLYKLLPDAPQQAKALFASLGLDSLNSAHGDWPGVGEAVNRIKYLLFGIILVLMMLLRPQGILPSRLRQQELKHGEPGGEQTVFDTTQAEF